MRTGTLCNGSEGQTGDLCQTDHEEAPWLALDFGSEVSESVPKVVLANSLDSNIVARTMNVNVWLGNVLPTSEAILFESGNFLGNARL